MDDSFPDPGPGPPNGKDEKDEKNGKNESAEIPREEIRFLTDVAARPLSTTLSRYERLHLSRRKGNAIRSHLLKAGIIEAARIATRSGQVILYQLTGHGRSVCGQVEIDPGPCPKEGLEHRYWVRRIAECFRRKGYDVTFEHPIKGNGAVDLLAERPGERVAIEVETGKSDVKANLKNALKGGFDRTFLVATSPAAVSVCSRALEGTDEDGTTRVELLTWLDIE